MGKEISRQNIIEAMDTLRNHKNDIIKIFNTSPLLTPANRINIVNHLTEFFDSTSEPDGINKLYSATDY
ncbi:MAG: hypothetical protein HC905_26775 [Bacteroidales bacterium]|nr:hypothetical protein [Bacteroidales bacterium]